MDPKIIVNSTTFDDAGIYRLDRHRALVQTVDFFTPIVDDPFSYGQIAAANSLSDIFAMGGRPLTALNIVGFPTDLIRPRVIAAILRGGLAKADEVGCAIIGGHSIRNPEPIYGLAVTGVVDVRRLTTNANARPGDLLGLHTVGAELAELRVVRAATDVTGYGLMGHLISLCRASRVSAEVDTSAAPMISDEIADLIEQGCVPGGSRENLVATTVAVDWGSTDDSQRILLTDAQTSGGLLLCVPEAKLDKVLGILRQRRTPCAAVIGRITAHQSRCPLICVKG